MLIQEITALLGDVPVGYEPLVYVCCFLFLLFLLDSFYSFLRILASKFLG